MLNLTETTKKRLIIICWATYWLIFEDYYSALFCWRDLANWKTFAKFQRVGSSAMGKVMYFFHFFLIAYLPCYCFNDTNHFSRWSVKNFEWILQSLIFFLWKLLPQISWQQEYSSSNWEMEVNAKRSYLEMRKFQPRKFYFVEMLASYEMCR